MKVSVVLPAKNEEVSVGKVVADIVAMYPSFEVILVNDGSTDETARVARHAGALVVSHPYSKGNGAAIKSGARAASGDVIVFMDADGQHDAADIQGLLDLIRDGYDLAVGARQRGSQASIGR